MSARPEKLLNPAYLSAHRTPVTDLAQVQSIIEDSTGTLRVRYGIGPWGLATTARQMERHMLQRHVYQVMYHRVCVGTFTLSLHAPQWYPLEAFADHNALAVYVSNFYIMPSMQRHGIGTWAIHKITTFAHNEGWQSVRGDIFATVSESVAFLNVIGVSWCTAVDYANHEHWLYEYTPVPA
jgi:GNAT superfamily N-acetyltransferase